MAPVSWCNQLLWYCLCRNNGLKYPHILNGKTSWKSRSRFFVNIQHFCNYGYLQAWINSCDIMTPLDDIHLVHNGLIISIWHKLWIFGHYCGVYTCFSIVHCFIVHLWRQSSLPHLIFNPGVIHRFSWVVVFFIVCCRLILRFSIRFISLL